MTAAYSDLRTDARNHCVALSLSKGRCEALVFDKLRPVTPIALRAPRKQKRRGPFAAAFQSLRG